MPIRKLYIVYFIVASLPFFWTFNLSCAKEYSFEGADTLAVNDTIIVPPAHPWICPACIGQDKQIEAKWSFYNDSSFSCGMIDTAIVNQERTAFTFFGPSACSKDTGMIIDVFLGGAALDRDLYNVTSKEGGFYYYDHVGPSYVFISHVANFKIVIDSYIHQTHLATGTFSGTVYKTNGAPTLITSGKFEVRLY